MLVYVVSTPSGDFQSILLLVEIDTPAAKAILVLNSAFLPIIYTNYNVGRYSSFITNITA